MNQYGLKILYQYTIQDAAHTHFFEEQIVTLSAVSFEAAYEIAQHYAEQQCDAHHNPYGKLVQKTVYDVVDCYVIDIEEADVQEVYSSIKQNKTGLADAVFLEGLCNGCAPEELYGLRYAAFNGDAEPK